MTETPHSLSPQDCLVALMLAVSASDEQLPTAELVTIQRIVDHLPVFAGYDHDRIPRVSQVVFDLYAEEEGLDALFDLILQNLPEPLYESAYAMACDVAAADGTLRDSELRLLEEMRWQLTIDRLAAAAIEHAARVRHRTT